MSYSNKALAISDDQYREFQSKETTLLILVFYLNLKNIYWQKYFKG
jgi:hypothetical protein